MTAPSLPPRLTVGYDADSVLLYRADEAGQPVYVVRMDEIAAHRYAEDLEEMATHLRRAAADYTHLRMTAAEIDAIIGDDDQPGE